MSEFQFNCMTHANHLMTTGSQSHHAAVHAALERMTDRYFARQSRQDRREKAVTRAINFSLGATTAIGILAAVGFLTTGVS